MWQFHWTHNRIYISYFWEFHIYIDKCKLCVYNTIVSLTDYKGRYLRILSHICWSVHSYISYSIPTYRCYIRICICIILFVILWCSRRFTVQRTLLNSCNGSVSIVLTHFPFFLGWVWPLLVRFLYHFLVIDAKIKLVIGIFFLVGIHSLIRSLVRSFVGLLVRFVAIRKNVTLLEKHFMVPCRTVDTIFYMVDM